MCCGVEKNDIERLVEIIVIVQLRKKRFLYKEHVSRNGFAERTNVRIDQKREFKDDF